MTIIHNEFFTYIPTLSLTAYSIKLADSPIFPTPHNHTIYSTSKSISKVIILYFVFSYRYMYGYSQVEANEPICIMIYTSITLPVIN